MSTQSESEKFANVGKTELKPDGELLFYAIVLAANKFPAEWPQNCVFCLIELVDKG